MSIEHIEVNGHELTAFDLPPEPSETYKVHVDGLGEILVERGKPPKEKDIPSMYMRKLVPELCEQNAELHRENAKLRELVHDMLIDPRDYCAKYGIDYDGWDSANDDIDRRLRELGIEV